MKAIGRQLLDFSVSSELYSCYLQLQDLTLSSWRTTDSLGNSLECLDVLVGTSLLIT